MAAMTTYLDYNASAPLRPGVEEAVVRGLAAPGNPSSIHRAGRTVRRLFEDARDELLSLVGRNDIRLVFTSGGTEANNLAIKGAAQLGIKRVLVSAVEHPSVLQPAEQLGAPVRILKVHQNGTLDLADLEAQLAASNDMALVCVMAANNETGVMQPIGQIADICRSHNALLHTDAVQCFGKGKSETGFGQADLLSISAHKIGGPLGIGALLFRSDLHVGASILGGGQELGYRSGTENVSGALGFAEAARQCAADLDYAARMTALRSRLEKGLKQVSSDVIIFGENAERLPNTACFAEPGIAAETAVMALDLAGFAVSAGSACSSGKVSKSHVISAMGWDDHIAGSSIRVSLGWGTEEDHIDRLLEAWADIRARLRAKNADRQNNTGVMAGSSA